MLHLQKSICTIIRVFKLGYTFNYAISCTYTLIFSYIPLYECLNYGIHTIIGVGIIIILLLFVYEYVHLYSVDNINE